MCGQGATALFGIQNLVDEARERNVMTEKAFSTRIAAKALKRITRTPALFILHRAQADLKERSGRSDRL